MLFVLVPLSEPINYTPPMVSDVGIEPGEPEAAGDEGRPRHPRSICALKEERSLEPPACVAARVRVPHDEEVGVVNQQFLPSVANSICAAAPVPSGS